MFFKKKKTQHSFISYLSKGHWYLDAGTGIYLKFMT